MYFGFATVCFVLAFGPKGLSRQPDLLSRFLCFWLVTYGYLYSWLCLKTFLCRQEIQMQRSRENLFRPDRIHVVPTLLTFTVSKLQILSPFPFPFAISYLQSICRHVDDAMMSTCNHTKLLCYSHFVYGIP